MKKFKKLTAAVAATLIAASMAVPVAFNTFNVAAATTVTFTNPTDKTINDIKAAKIFTADATATKFTVTGWAFGDVNKQKALAESISAPADVYTKNDAEEVIAVDAVKVANALSGAGNDSDTAKKFARAAVNAGITGSDSITVNYDSTEKKATLSGLEKGYYVVTCTAGNANEKVYSLGMLKAVEGEAEISLSNAKIGLPTVQKKVYEDVKASEVLAPHETEDKKWNDIADYDIGDDVPFKLYGTMPENLGFYDHYYYEFSDTLDSQFDLKADTIEIKVDGNKITLNDTDTDTLFTYTGTAGTTDIWIIPNGTSIRIIFEDIKALDVKTTSVVTVEYKATLNGTANVGKPGQDNAVKLIYSNNPNVNYNPDNNVDKPNQPGTPDTPGNNDKSETPEDRVRVFTYAIKIEKKFFTGDDSPLTVAEVLNKFQEVQFSLQKVIDENTKEYVNVVGLTDKTDYDYNVNGTTTTKTMFGLTVVDGEGKVWTVNDEKTALTDGTVTLTPELKENADGTTTWKFVDSESGTEYSASDFKMLVRVKGLDDGTYILTEEAGPDDYNKAKPQEIEIKADTEHAQDITLSSDAESKPGDRGFTKVQYKIDKANEYTDATDATAKAEVHNKQGIEIPSTGGIGTKLFYLGGGAMVTLAGIFLITKKRMGKESE